MGGSFLLDILLPAAELSADFIEEQYELPIICMIEHLVLPSYLKEEFENVIFSYSMGDQRQLFKFIAGKARSENKVEEK